MTPINELPSVVINDLVLYMQGLGDCDWQERCATKASIPLDQRLREGIAPKHIHDLMVAATVFGKPERAAEVMRTWMADLPSDSWQKWFDVTNVSASTKRCYGHEALSGQRSDGDAQHSPLAKVLMDSGYLTTRRTSKGPLQSLLMFPSGDSDEDGHLLDLMLTAEMKAPGCCITDDAREALVRSSLKSLALVKTIDLGLDLGSWLGQAGSRPALDAEINMLRLSVDARRAAVGAIEDTAAPSMKSTNP